MVKEINHLIPKSEQLSDNNIVAKNHEKTAMRQNKLLLLDEICATSHSSINREKRNPKSRRFISFRVKKQEKLKNDPAHSS